MACDAKGNLTLLNQAIRRFHGLAELPTDDNLMAHQFDLYHADGLTPMTAQEVPLYRAFQGERIAERGNRDRPEKRRGTHTPG